MTNLVRQPERMGWDRTRIQSQENKRMGWLQIVTMKCMILDHPLSLVVKARPNLKVTVSKVIDLHSVFLVNQDLPDVGFQSQTLSNHLLREKTAREHCYYSLYNNLTFLISSDYSFSVILSVSYMPFCLSTLLCYLFHRCSFSLYD